MTDIQSPLERITRIGPEFLADDEVLGLLTGNLSAARETIAQYGSLDAVARLEVAELEHFKGIGSAIAGRVAAAFELSRRLRARQPMARTILSSPTDVYAAFGPLMEDLPREVFRIATLDTKNQLIRDRVVSEGTLSATLVHPREVMKPVILDNAYSVILVHNHPSGDPTPSRDDIRLTRQLVEAARILDLRIHDHVVIGRGRFVSLAERGVIE